MRPVLDSYLRGSLNVYYIYIEEATPRNELSKTFSEYTLANRTRTDYNAQEAKLRECMNIFNSSLKSNVFDSSPNVATLRDARYNLHTNQFVATCRRGSGEEYSLDRLLSDDIVKGDNLRPYTIVTQYSYHSPGGVSWDDNGRNFYFNTVPIDGSLIKFNNIFIDMVRKGGNDKYTTYYRNVYHLDEFAANVSCSVGTRALIAVDAYGL